MNTETFDPFAGDEVASTIAADPDAVPAATSAGVDPFAAPTPPAPAAEPAQPETPKIKRYEVVHHPAHGYGLVLAAGELPGVTANRNAVIVGWFASVSDPITTDQLESVANA
jgi:hypothetical protein